LDSVGNNARQQETLEKVEHNVIMIKSKVLLPQAYVTLADFGDPV